MRVLRLPRCCCCFSCSGGELFYECVIEESFQESDVTSLVRQIVDGLIYLHDRSIVHLDLKVLKLHALSVLSRGGGCQSTSSLHPEVLLFFNLFTCFHGDNLYFFVKP